MDVEKYAKAISLGSGEALECPNNKGGVRGPTLGEGGLRFVCSDNERRSIKTKQLENAFD